jgi:hypothetical protein
MADTWPASLPQCFDRPYSGGMGDGRGKYAPDIGPPIVRRRTTAVVDPLSGTMRMSLAQRDAMRTFIRETLLEGSLPFTFPDQDGGGTLLVMLDEQSMPGWLPIGGGNFKVSIALKVMP